MRPAILLLILTTLWSCTPRPGDQPPTGDQIAEPRLTRTTVTSADGVPIACTSRGTGDVALVFIHGGFADQSTWSEQVEALAGAYRVVTLDLAGHGASGAEREAWTLEAFGADVKAVVEYLALERVVLVGHSLGRPVALAAAQQMPERVAGIVAVDTLGAPRREVDGRMVSNMAPDCYYPVSDRWPAG